MKDDFDFEDYKLESDSSDDGSFESNDDSDIQNFNTNTKSNVKATNKSIIAIVIIAVVFVAVILFSLKLFQKLSIKNEAPDIEATPTVTENIQNNEVENTPETTIKPENVEKPAVVNNSNNDSSNQNNGWSEFESDDSVTFNKGYLDLTFTVTDIKHYVKHTGNDMVETKTVLTGALSGFSGAYEIDIPYIKGILINIGDCFNVQVKIGETNSSKKVIGEIKY